MDDVVIVGAGPAGAIAALVLARAGVRVRLLDRASFPRDKLCGDTINPGTLAQLRRHGVADAIERQSLRIDGMRVTGHGASVDAAYPDGVHGRSLIRRDLDAMLVEAAIAAGAQFEPGVAVRRAIMLDAGARGLTCGGVVVGRGPGCTIRAPVVIAADGRRSTIGFQLGLARHPPSPRRWAAGAYFEEAVAGPHVGEMHVRHDGYVGVAPLPGGLTNVCVVRASGAGDPAYHDPVALVSSTLHAEPRLAERFQHARLVTRPVVVGPLAVDVAPATIPGLLQAGDAAGFVDPITGDGLRFAVRGGELAAGAALAALQHGWANVHRELAAARAREFGPKRRFNRSLRTLVSWPSAIAAAEWVATLAPGVLRAAVRYAGDCGVGE